MQNRALRYAMRAAIFSLLVLLFPGRPVEAQIDRITGKPFATRSEVLARACFMRQSAKRSNLFTEIAHHHTRVSSHFIFRARIRLRRKRFAT